MGWSSNCIKRNLHQSLLSTSKTKSNRHQKAPPPPRCTQSALKQNRTSSSTCEHLLWRKEDVWDRSPLCSRWIRWVDLPASVLMSSSASLKVEADLIRTSSMQHHDLILFFFLPFSHYHSVSTHNPSSLFPSSLSGGSSLHLFICRPINYEWGRGLWGEAEEWVWYRTEGRRKLQGCAPPWRENGVEVLQRCTSKSSVW